MEPPVSAAPTLESEEAYEEALLALEELTRLVRAHPEVLRALQLRQGAEDRSIMKGLGKFTDLFDVLRAAGCSIPEASRGELLYELACQVRPASRVKRSKRWLWFCAAGLLVSILLGFSLLIVLQVTQATRGYQVGDCIINLFTNSSCQQAPGCFVEVAVRSGELFMVKSTWALPVEHTGPEADFTRYAGDPFRCCNDDQGQVPKCCDLVSGGIQMRTAETFCDSWGTLGKVDWLGQPCNVAAWPCLFSVDPLGENIDELMFFVQPDISGYLVVVIGSFVLLSMLFLVPLIMKYVRCDCDPEPSKEDEEGGELFDPDDPKCDWGAAVQEALQDEYRRRKEMGGCERLKTLLARARELWRLVACRCRRRPSTPRVTQAGRATTRGSLVQDGRWSMRSSTQDLRGSTLRGSHLSQDGLRASTLRGSQMSQDGLRTSTLRGSYLSQDGLRSSLRASHVSQDGARKSMRASQVPWDEPPAPPEPTVVLPPGFIWHGEEEPNAMVKKYQTWEAVDKEVNDFQETDIHPGFQLGNLSGLARLAVHQKENLCAPIVEPIPKAKSYGNTHYSMSSFREGRNKRKKRRPKADAKKLQDRELADKLRFAAKGPAAGMLE